MLEWIQSNEALSLWLVGASLAMLAATAAVVPWVLVRIPADYFAGPKRLAGFRVRGNPSIQWVLLMIGKNVAGGILVLAGIAMLVLPGQGILTIALGVAVMSFPGKFRLERWVISRGPTLRIINALRRRHGREPLVLVRD